MVDDDSTRNVTGDHENLGYLEDLIRLVCPHDRGLTAREEIKTTCSTTDNGGGERKEMDIPRRHPNAYNLRKGLYDIIPFQVFRTSGRYGIMSCTQIAEEVCTTGDVIPRSDVVHRPAHMRAGK